MAAVAEIGRIPTGYAYLDLAEPDLDTAVATLAAAGHRRAVVVPLLFSVAFHATIDVPQAVSAAAESSGIELTVADILGTGNDIAELLSASLAEAGVPPEASVLLYAVGSSNPAANAAVVDLAARLEASRWHLAAYEAPVRAAFATCSPGPTDVLDELRDPVAVLPLFLADGLLLDPVRALAAERGWRMVEPLGERAAGIVLDRYRAAVNQPADRFDP